VRADHHIPGALSILKGAVPDRTRGFGHTAPTYVSRFPGSNIPRPGRHLNLRENLADRLIEEAKAALRIKDEMDCSPILVRLMDQMQTVCLPVVLGDDQPLELRVWEQGTPLYEAGFGTLAPSETAPHIEPDVIVMPLLGFDSRGTRLGYGGGYYDRTLARLSKRPRLIGLAFSAQELPEIPREPHDIPLDAIVTERGVRNFHGGTSQ